MKKTMSDFPLLGPGRSLGFGGGMDKACPTQSGGDGFLIARGNATYYNNIPATKIGVTRVGFRTVSSITQEMFP